MTIDVKTFCLAVLTYGETTGYEIRKAGEEGAFSQFFAAGFGSIYPALKALNEDGLIEEVAQAGDRGRSDRRVYRLTDRGLGHLRQALTAAPSPDRMRSEFMFQLFLAQLLSPEHANRIIQARISECEARIAEIDCCPVEETARPGDRFMSGLGRAIYAAMRDYLIVHGSDLVDEIEGREKAAGTSRHRPRQPGPEAPGNAAIAAGGQE